MNYTLISKPCALPSSSFFDILGCHCAKEPKKHLEVQNWRWGGCGDNLHYGRKISRQFLQLRQTGDHLTDILRHNGELGLRALTLVDTCRCQGVSGSCTINICWKKLVPFEQTAAILKAKYQEAMKVRTDNKPRKRYNRKEKIDKLLYFSKSPTFCEATSHRRCLNPENCATLCCTRGYDTKMVEFTKLCNCRCDNICWTDMKCDNCSYVEEEYYCKP